MNPKHPLYIPSKGRWESRLTSKALEAMRVPYYIVVEESEYERYADVIDPAKVLVLDPQYQRDYDPFDDLGDTKPKGSGPARNFIWDHALANGATWHWTIDDNISTFLRFNRNLEVPVADGSFFRLMEEFCERYENVAMAGPNYQAFNTKREPNQSPFTPNTRIYSCNLIRSDVPYRWRGRFNEDTDLSLRMLKDGWCTVLFQAFLQKKMTTLKLRGGNTDTVYVDGTLPKSRQIAEMHPDVCKVVWKFNRWHHHCDYRPFKANELRRRPDVVIPEGVNEYGMRLVKVSR